MKVAVLKIGDIHKNELSEDLFNFLYNLGEVTYKDQVLKEDIYNVSSTIEQIDDEEISRPSSKVYAELKKIDAALQKKDCGYLRIVFS